MGLWAARPRGAPRPVRPMTEPTSPQASRRSRLLKAFSWATAGHGLSQAIRLASSIVLTRLLVPEVYGLMELVWVFNTGINLLSDVGIETCIVHSRRGDEPRFLNTAWTMQVVRGGLLFFASLIGAYPMAVFFDQPQLTSLIPAVGLGAVLTGFAATSIQTERRRLNLGAVIRLELVGQVASVVTQVVVALVWPTVWVFVFGFWVTTVIRLVGSFRYLDGISHRFEWDVTAIREIYEYGRWIFGSTAIHYVASSGDRLILARLLDGLSVLGVYGIAMRLQSAFLQLHGRLTTAVVFPALSEKARDFDPDDPKRAPALSRMYYKSRLGLDAVFITGAGGLVAVAIPLVGWIYDEDYAGAGWILQIVALQIVTAAMLRPPENLLTAVGHTKYGFFRSLSRGAWTVTALPLGWWIAGFPGLVWAVALIDIPAAFVIWPAMIRHGFFDGLRELASLGFFGVGWAVGTGLLAIF